MNKKGEIMKKLFLIISMLLIISCKGELVNAEINIPTAQCGMCAITIEEALTKVDGVKKALVDMDALKVTVAYNPDKKNLKSLEIATILIQL